MVNLRVSQNYLFKSIIFIFFLISLNIYSQVKRTDWFFSFGLGTNLNFHSADFKSISKSDIDWSGYKSGFGLGENIFGGIEYRFPKQFLSSEIRGRLNIGYSNLSADLTEDEFIGHVITGNTYTNGISEHIVESTISTVMVEPQFIIYPMNGIPLGTFAGFQFGFPVKMNYMQEERLKSPDFGTYENGLRVREHSEGIIPNSSSVYFAISFGARYELYKFGDFTLLPELKFNFGLTNLADNLNWKASSLSLVAVIQYNPSISKPAPPPEPPPPVKLQPPKPELPELALRVFHNGNELKNGDTIKVKVSDTLFVRNFFITPIIFFKDNETEIKGLTENPATQEEAQTNVIHAVQKYLENNPDDNVKIISSNIENNNISENRVDKIYEALKANKKKIKTEKIMKNDKFKYPELAEENRYIEFEFGKGKDGLTVEGDTVVKSSAEKISFEIETSIKSQDEYKFEGKIIAGNKEINLNEGEHSYNLNEIITANDIKNVSVMKIHSDVTEKSSQEISTDFLLHIKAETIENIVVENNIKEKDSEYAEFILGFCEFGKSDFYSINRHALEFIKKAVKEGKKIELLPLTDSLGSIEYNKELANKRAEAALKLLSLKKNDVKLSIPVKYFFLNTTPEGRLLNRSVIVRVY